MEGVKMLFELTNEQRVFLGLTLTEESWDRVKFNDTTFLYFDGNRLVKKISVDANFYYEIALDERTSDNRSIVLPRTERGKAKKFNYTALQSMSGVGVYFRFDKYVTIGNFTTQRTFYSSSGNEEKMQNISELKKWIDWWISDTSENNLTDINLFKSAKRVHCKYYEGDFFAFKLGRRRYGFGRILLDVSKVTKDIKSGKLKEKHYGLIQLMGKALIIKIYNFTSDMKKIDLNELKRSDSFLSQPVMDNVFYYGEYEIIGNEALEDFELEFPISYSRSISAKDRNTVYLQYGLIYKEIDISRYNKYLSNEGKVELFSINPYRNESIGYGIKKGTLKQLQGLSSPIDESFDLRSGKNKDIKNEIFSTFGLDANKSYAENYEICFRTK